MWFSLSTECAEARTASTKRVRAAGAHGLRTALGPRKACAGPEVAQIPKRVLHVCASHQPPIPRQTPSQTLGPPQLCAQSRGILRGMTSALARRVRIPLREAAGVLLAVFLSSGRATAHPPDPTPWAVTTGLSELLVLGPVSSALSTSWDVTAHGPLFRALAWSAGGRLSFGPVSPEAFARLSAAPKIERWSPSVGVELGVSRRAHDDQGGALLSELREQSRSDLAPLYLAMHAMPLRFVVWRRLSLSALEFQAGTYVAPFGRFVRLQLGFISGGMVL